MRFSTIICIIISLTCTFALKCDRVRSRPDIRKISSDKLNRYINAVKKLNTGPRPTEWDKFAKKHVQYYKQIHSDPQFLAWHRIFLHEVEEKLREIDNEVRIPYWDWTVYNRNMNDDPIWGIMGKNGDSSDKCVRSGSFNGFNVLYGDSPDKGGRCIRRNSRFDTSFGGDKDTINEIIDSRDIKFFAEYLEGVPHAIIHNGVGEEFQGHASPGDPLFFSHHAFVDKIWFDRQNRYPETALTYHLQHRVNIVGYNKQVWESIDPIELCYTYIEDGFNWEVNNFVRMQSASLDISDVPIYVPLTKSNSTSSSSPTNEERQEHARKYILEGIVAPDVNNCPAQGPDGTPTKPFGKILDIEYIDKMKYDEASNRRLQRWRALGISEKNKQILA